MAQRLSYREVPAIADNKTHELHLPMLNAIAIARGFLKQRRARGALAFLGQQQMLLTDEEGRIRHYDASEMVGHILVQEMMIAANSAVAEFAARSNIPFLYRCHEPRISAPRGVAATESFEAWIAGGHATTAAAAERLNLIAQKARYTSTLTGHFGPTPTSPRHCGEGQLLHSGHRSEEEGCRASRLTPRTARSDKGFRPLASVDEALAPSPAAAPTASPVPTSNPQLPIAKGALLEHCQKRKLGTPTFTSTSAGPSNAPTYVCVVELAVTDSRVTARSPESSTKRQAEALAAEALLEQLLVSAPGSKGRDVAPAAPAARSTPGDQVAPMPVQYRT